MKTVIFDLGNVLTDFDWPSFVKRVVPDETAAKVLDQAFWRNELWHEMDRGAFAEETVHRELIKNCPGYEEIAEEVYRRLGETVHRFPYAEDWIKELQQKGYQVLFLSNYSDYLIRLNPDAVGFTSLMDGGIFSYQVKLIKPDLAIYDRLRKTYDLDPSQCLFVDDKYINVVAAKEYGFHALRFISYEETKPLVDAYLKEH